MNLGDISQAKDPRTIDFDGLTFFRHLSSENPAIYWMRGSLFVLFCLELLVRAVAWTFKPDLGLFDSTAPALFHFFAVIVFEVGWALGFVMINAQRVENELKTLSGLLPICASCKKIRDDKGYWNQLEDYIGRHSKAEFSHGICPTCAEELYPEIFPKAG